LILASEVLKFLGDGDSFAERSGAGIRTLRYVVSTHAADELEDDNLSILDLENIVLTGQIVERQRDRAARETKCVIQGVALEALRR